MKNQVELLGYYGSDYTHALSAWCSTVRELTDERKLRMPGLLKMLAREGHHTPFEKSYFHFLITCETASHIHILKHRIGVSVNGESARYKELKEDKFYVPQDWPEDVRQEYTAWIDATYSLYHKVLNRLEVEFGRKRAKESARFLLPYANQIQLDVSFNWRSLAWFLGLRKKDEAQEEIHDIADQMLELVRSIGDFPYTLEAFGYGKAGQNNLA